MPFDFLTEFGAGFSGESDEADISDGKALDLKRYIRTALIEIRQIALVVKVFFTQGNGKFL